MSMLSGLIKKTMEKEQRICKLHTYKYTSNIPKQDNTFS